MDVDSYLIFCRKIWSVHQADLPAIFTFTVSNVDIDINSGDSDKVVNPVLFLKVAK